MKLHHLGIILVLQVYFHFKTFLCCSSKSRMCCRFSLSSVWLTSGCLLSAGLRSVCRSSSKTSEDVQPLEEPQRWVFLCQHMQAPSQVRNNKIFCSAFKGSLPALRTNQKDTLSRPSDIIIHLRKQVTTSFPAYLIVLVTSGTNIWMLFTVVPLQCGFSETGPVCVGDLVCSPEREPVTSAV